ncbi:hypothetical protein F-M6_0141 [Faustovirus]|nr:hypothetical protein F-M6_0141 [Faustovirus]
MLRYAGYELKITQSIVQAQCDLPSDLKGAYEVVLNVDETVQCRQITPVSLHMDVDITDVYPCDRISIRIDSNINMSYWIVAIVKYINLVVDDNDNDNQCYNAVTMGDVIKANITSLYVPEHVHGVIDLIPGYRYLLYKTVNPWVKLNPVVSVNRSGRGSISISPGVNDWQIVIHYTTTNEYIVAVRQGADNYRTAPRYANAISDFVDIYRCIYLDYELDPELNDIEDIDNIDSD